MGNYQPVDGMDKTQVTDELLVRQGPHEELELRGGDVLAWRYQAASYYCQMANIELKVNGSAFDLNTPGVDVR